LKKNTIKNKRRGGKPGTGKAGRKDALKKLDAAEKMGEIYILELQDQQPQ
jgi:hypothetical protein